MMTLIIVILKEVGVPTALSLRDMDLAYPDGYTLHTQMGTSCI